MQHPRPPILDLQDGFVREPNRLREYWFPTRSHSILHVVHCFSIFFLCFFCKVSFSFFYSFFFFFFFYSRDVRVTRVGESFYNPLSFCFISFASFVSPRIDSCAMFCRSRSPPHASRERLDVQGGGGGAKPWILKMLKIAPYILRLVAACTWHLARRTGGLA